MSEVSLRLHGASSPEPVQAQTGLGPGYIEQRRYACDAPPEVILERFYLRNQKTYSRLSSTKLA
jgi:hypothetical protein